MHAVARSRRGALRSWLANWLTELVLDRTVAATLVARRVAQPGGRGQDRRGVRLAAFQEFAGAAQCYSHRSVR